ncbi:hypothetical protein SH2C18_19910 [Clostridium sediminicola]|uniref:DEAD/DEAH box helicase n=1 Tax=Clostridium sediminicola TaxID=3114879 RepID=UPI0031F20481
MNKTDIINKVESIINGELNIDESIKVDNNDNSVDTFFESTAIRLVKTYINYINGLCGHSDYLVSLRNFMLVYQTSLRVNNLDIPDNNEFGIFKDSISHKYYASYSIPASIKFDSFVKDSFIDVSTEEPTNETKYLLRTNSYIRKVTGFDYFKSMEQKLCVYGALNTPAGFTTLVSMPTGGGKSLVTQALGYETIGLTIVIVPTVSLAIDQVRVAKKNIRCIKENEVFCYYSGVKNFSEISNAIKDQTAKLLFISPEALIKNNQFKQLIGNANQSKYIKNIVVDEAHIVVAWGDFFRVDYQCLGPWRRELLKVNPSIRTFLLSATFRDDTVITLKRFFSSEDKWIEIRCDSLRREPRYILEKAKNYHHKKECVLRFVNLLPRPMILYVNAPYQAKMWKDFLERYGYGNIRTFTGDTKSDDRERLIKSWGENEYDLMIATSAFGVGVDKADVRSVIHLYVPENPDSYYQELGRGGRDGLPCLSVMCVEDSDINEGVKHITKVLKKDTFWGRWWSMYTNPQNQWQGGLIATMASTKPHYNKINYFEEGNDTDEKWNINVLLLLSRYHQIEIVALDLDEKNRYMFTIKILNDLLMQNTDESKHLFEAIRDKEANKARSTFNLLKMAIAKKDKLCWSEMFFDTYPLVSEYCPGCNYHENIVADELRRFPLLEDVTGPEKLLSAEMIDFFSGTKEALIITDCEYSEIINEYKPDVIVCEDIVQDDNMLFADINYMNFAEFRDMLTRDNGFYISGLIMPFYSSSPSVAKEEYHTMYKYINKKGYIIHVTGKDFMISNVTGKMLSEQIGGTVIKK